MLFSHGGKFGDLVYALPAIGYLGGGDLALYPNPHTGMTFTPENVELIRPLLEAQGYINSVRYTGHPVGLNLDTFRHHWRGNLNISDILHNWLGLPFPSRTEPWLAVEPVRVAPVVLARCPRYHNGNFPWPKAVDRYGRDAVFIGHPDEHADFCRDFGRVAYHPTRDFLEAARVVAGADLCVMNQSAPRAIAEGLKAAIVQETALNDDNCHWGRPNAWYGYRADVHLPDLAEARTATALTRVAGRTLLDEQRLWVLARCAAEAAALPGAAAECGVGRGGASRLIGLTCPHKTLHVFDTFAGLPCDEDLAGVHKKGEFAADRAEVEGYLGGLNVEVHAGLFPETVRGLEGLVFSLVHLDLDLYEPTVAALDFFWPRMVPGGVVVVDDVDWHHTPGVNRALAERGLLSAVERPARQQGVLRKPGA